MSQNYMEMENSRKACKSSGDKFSFPIMIPNPDPFEFGSVTSPSSPNSPADHLFSNGKLLPHTYRLQSPHNVYYSRSSSRTSSKGSLMSSRSNSTTSSRSSASTRTSTSEPPSEADCGAGRREKIVRPLMSSCQYQYGSSRRWQLIAAAPVLRKQASSRSKKIDTSVDRKVGKGSMGADEECKGSKSWCGRRFFKSFLSACKECHAIKT